MPQPIRTISVHRLPNVREFQTVISECQDFPSRNESISADIASIRFL